MREQKVEREILVQLLKSGTSIGANIEEAIGGSSRKDFIYKMEIAYRESRESFYWLRLFKATDLPEAKLADSLVKDCEEIIRILTTILKSSKNHTVPILNS